MVGSNSPVEFSDEEHSVGARVTVLERKHRDLYETVVEILAEIREVKSSIGERSGIMSREMSRIYLAVNELMAEVKGLRASLPKSRSKKNA